MSERQHVQAVRIGTDISRRLKILQDGLGTSQRPGRLTMLYLKYTVLLREAKTLKEVRNLLSIMRIELEELLINHFSSISMLGNILKDELAKIYDLAAGEGSGSIPKDIIIAALAAFDVQRDKVLAGTRLGYDKDILFGSTSRVGVLSYGSVAKNVDLFAPALISFIIDNRIRFDEKYFKQAVAVLDLRTTNCCLLVHGQVQEWNKPFNLVGTPRYANWIKFPPFHNWCRTVVVLVHEEDVNDSVTKRMLAEARALLPIP